MALRCYLDATWMLLEWHLVVMWRCGISQTKPQSNCQGSYYFSSIEFKWIELNFMADAELEQNVAHCFIRRQTFAYHLHNDSGASISFAYDLDSLCKWDANQPVTSFSIHRSDSDLNVSIKVDPFKNKWKCSKMSKLEIGRDLKYSNSIDEYFIISLEYFVATWHQITLIHWSFLFI